jgi:hypothetical protein
VRKGCGEGFRAGWDAHAHGKEDVDKQVARAACDERRRCRREQDRNLRVHDRVSPARNIGRRHRTRMRSTSEPWTAMLVYARGYVGLDAESGCWRGR